VSQREDRKFEDRIKLVMQESIESKNEYDNSRYFKNFEELSKCIQKIEMCKEWIIISKVDKYVFLYLDD
jgi:hypothetical protein